MNIDTLSREGTLSFFSSLPSLKGQKNCSRGEGSNLFPKRI